MIIITLRIRILFLTPFVASCCRAFKLATGGTQRFSSPRVARLRDLRVLNHYRRWHVPGLGLKISADQPGESEFTWNTSGRPLFPWLSSPFFEHTRPSLRRPPKRP